MRLDWALHGVQLVSAFAHCYVFSTGPGPSLTLSKCFVEEMSVAQALVEQTGPVQVGVCSSHGEFCTVEGAWWAHEASIYGNHLSTRSAPHILV